VPPYFGVSLGGLGRFGSVEELEADRIAADEDGVGELACAKLPESRDEDRSMHRIESTIVLVWRRFGLITMRGVNCKGKVQISI
jgi:hypothetical protein